MVSRESTTGRTRAGVATVVAMACAAEFMVVMDASIVAVASPTIGQDLGLSAGSLSWVVNAYVLLFAGGMLLGGRLGDVLGVRRVFVVATVLFAAASLAAGLATTGATLIAARAVQGLGGAALAPVSLALISQVLTAGPARSRAVGIWTAVGVAGGAVGNVVGGALTQLADWRWVFLLNVPLGVLTVAGIAFVLPRDATTRRSQAPRARRLDVRGAVLATVGLVLASWSISGTGITASAALTSEGVRAVMLAVAVGLLIGFVRSQRRPSSVRGTEQDVAEPLLPLTLFSHRGISAGTVSMMLAGASLMPMWFYLSLLMQDTLGYDALHTGLGFLPHAVVSMLVGAGLAPRLMDHLSPRLLVVTGCIVSALGFGYQAQVAGTGGGYASVILGPAIVITLGGGLLNTPLTAAILAGAPAEQAGAVSGLLNTTKQIGAAIGLAALTALITTSGPADYRPVFVAMAVLMTLAAASSRLLPTPTPAAT